MQSNSKFVNTSSRAMSFQNSKKKDQVINKANLTKQQINNQRQDSSKAQSLDNKHHSICKHEQSFQISKSNNLFGHISKQSNPQENNNSSSRLNSNNSLNMRRFPPSCQINNSNTFNSSNTANNYYNNLSKQVKNQIYIQTQNNNNILGLNNNPLKNNELVQASKQNMYWNNQPNNMFQNSSSINNKQETTNNSFSPYFNDNNRANHMNLGTNNSYQNQNRAGICFSSQNNFASLINNRDDFIQNSNNQNLHLKMHPSNLNYQNLHQGMQFNMNLQNNMQNKMNANYQHSPIAGISQNEFLQGIQNSSTQNQFQYSLQNQQYNFNNQDQQHMLLNYQIQLQIEATFNKYLQLFQQQINNPHKFNEQAKKQQQNQIKYYLFNDWNYNYPVNQRYSYQQRQKRNNTVKVIINQNDLYNKRQARVKRQQFYRKYHKNKIIQESQRQYSYSEKKQKKNLRINKNQNKENVVQIVQKQQIINPEVSDFDQTVSLQYTVDLRWQQEKDFILRQFKKSTVQVSSRPSIMEIDQAIILDLKKQGYVCQKGIKLQVKQCQHKKIIPNFFYRLLGRKEQWTKNFYYIGSLLKKKVTLPEGYQFTPRQFKGFIIKDLTIMNKFGKVQWEGQTNIQNINFMNGGIKIKHCEIECTIPELQKQALFEMYTLPIFLREQKSSKQIRRQLKQMVEKSNNAKFLEFNQSTRSWKVKINLGKQQFQMKQSRK